MKKTAILLGMVFFMFGCSSLKSNSGEMKKEESISSLYSKEYTLENSDITINFEKDRLYGFSGVNRYMGNYTVDKDNIKIENLGSTMMLGESQKMEEETKYLKDLSEVNKFIIEGNKLILTDGKVTLKFQNLAER
ncbi:MULTISPECIES: META domain-containing protein [Fusobacterium]|jgi:heat shock protein HslJ|uniref:META domain-containing protein n=1 Tax=Fusobacterium hominis TaxID=2764326 RepID=A0A7G9GY14_9FUSO|nr:MULTISPECIES: META domain-containing protein [Fusobacterium]QNM15696.1 META domain-containing protein [Fusobacterium hominis]